MAKRLQQLRCLLAVLVMAAGALVGSSQGAFAEACKDYKGNDGHLITFHNMSGEEVVIGVFGTEFNSVTDKPDAANPFKGYAQADDWVLPAGKTIAWCAAKHFNGRFFARTGCSDGKCRTGDCCSGAGCPNNICDKGAGPTSLAEVFFDSKSGTYFDISLVDGYDFPLLMDRVNWVADPDNKNRNCSDAGCKNLPNCPYPMVDGVCRAPYKQFELTYQDYKYRSEYYPLAAACVNYDKGAGKFIDNVCGCGLTSGCNDDKLTACPTSVADVSNPYSESGEKVTLVSSGCSPINKSYDGTHEETVDGKTITVANGNGTEKDQIACDPMKPDSTLTDPYKTKCHPWSAAYKTYVTSIENACAGQGVYTWQYSDTSGGRDCKNTDDFGFAITVLPRQKSGPQADLITIAPDATLTGKLTRTDADGSVTHYAIKPPERINILVATGDTLNVSLNCPDPVNYSFNCNLTYTSGKGFDAGTNTKCAAFADWKKTDISLGGIAADNSQCTLGSDKYFLQISPGGDVVGGHVCIGTDAVARPFSPPAVPIQVMLRDKELFRLVENCGVDQDGKDRILACSADFSLTGGFTPRKIDGQSSVCTDDRINWGQIFKDKNLGLGAFNPDVDCVPGTYEAACPATYTPQDARNGLRLHNNLPTTQSNLLKLDQDKDGDVDMIDTIMMLRRSTGL